MEAMLAMCSGGRIPNSSTPSRAITFSTRLSSAMFSPLYQRGFRGLGHSRYFRRAFPACQRDVRRQTANSQFCSGSPRACREPGIAGANLHTNRFLKGELPDAEKLLAAIQQILRRIEQRQQNALDI